MPTGVSYAKPYKFFFQGLDAEFVPPSMATLSTLSSTLSPSPSDHREANGIVVPQHAPLNRNRLTFSHVGRSPRRASSPISCFVHVSPRKSWHSQSSPNPGHVAPSSRPSCAPFLNLFSIRHMVRSAWHKMVFLYRPQADSLPIQEIKEGKPTPLS